MNLPRLPQKLKGLFEFYSAREIVGENNVRPIENGSSILDHVEVDCSTKRKASRWWSMEIGGDPIGETWHVVKPRLGFTCRWRATSPLGPTGDFRTANSNRRLPKVHEDKTQAKGPSAKTPPRHPHPRERLFTASPRQDRMTYIGRLLLGEGHLFQPLDFWSEKSTRWLHFFDQSVVRTQGNVSPSSFAS